MDGLALLCNLHADGPLTLRRLRHLGVRSLHDLDRLPEATLVDWLGAPRARRFVEEARALARRLVETPLEPEEAAPALPAGESTPLERSEPERERSPALGDVGTSWLDTGTRARLEAAGV